LSVSDESKAPLSRPSPPPPPRPSKPPPRTQPDDAAVLALQNDLQRFQYSQRTQEWALWLLYIEGPGVDPFCERLLRRRLVIGRDSGCSLPLQGEGMAPQHALLEHHDESDLWAITPVSKELPTFVNGKRAHARTLLGPEDRVQIGPWRLRIGIEGDDEWHQKLRFATLHSPPAVPGLANVGSTKPDRLVVLSGPVPVKEIRLDEGPVRLGPVKGSSLVPEAGALAGLDVEIAALPDGRYELVCNSDGQPVSVNGVVERRAVLAAGDRLCLGSGGGAAYLIFAARGPSPEGAAAEKKKSDSSSRNLRAGAPALASASSILTAPTPSPASEGGVVWSLQAIGLDATSPTPCWLDPPKLDDLPPSVAAPPAPEKKAGQAQRVSRPTAVLMVVTTFLLGVFFLGVTTLVRGRGPESNALADVAPPDAKPAPAPKPPPDEARDFAPPVTRAAAVVAPADAAPTTTPAATTRPADASPVALLPAAEPPAARPADLPVAAPPVAEPPAPRAAEPPAAVVRPADMPVAAPPARPEVPAVAAKPLSTEAARGPSAAPEAARGPSAAPRPPEPAARPAAKPAEAPRAPAAKEAPRPSQAAGQGGTICDRLRALQRSGRATPDDERMLQRCH
jgi:FHA domain-containing protein